MRFSLGSVVCALLLFSRATDGMAQVPCGGSIDLGPDTMLCAGDNMVVTAPAGYPGYQWNTGDSTQAITVDTSGVYVCSVAFIDTAANLVYNGDFSLGSTGFTSDYVPGTGGT